MNRNTKAISFLFLLGACALREKQFPPLEAPFEARKERIRQCYTESESFTIKLPGKMDVSVLILSDGSVKEAKILSSDFKDPNFAACVHDQLKKLRFLEDKTRQTLEIRKPLTFTTGIP